MIHYLKFGGLALIEVAIFWAGWHLGGLQAKNAEDVARAAQLSAVASAYQDQVIAVQASNAKLQSVENAYDAVKDLPDVAVPTIVDRLRIVACPSGSGQLSKTNAVAGGTANSSAVPAGTAPIATALGNLLSACDADAKRLAAVQALAP